MLLLRMHRYRAPRANPPPPAPLSQSLMPNTIILRAHTHTQSWWQVELGLLVGVSLLCLFVFPVAVPVLVPLWIFRTCVYFGVC